MEQHISYALEVIVCSGLLYAFYKMVMEGKTDYGFCRFYLISGLVLSAVIPLLRIPVFPGEIIETPSILTQAFITSDVPVSASDVEARPDYLLWGYFSVSVFLLAGIISQLIGIAGYRKNATKTRSGNIRIYESESIKTPFTFFNSVFLPSGLRGEERLQILTHESSHARHNHGTEILLMELLKALLWFNPFAWLSRKSLEQVHEYQADSDVIETGYDIFNYKTLLFKQLTGYSPDITSGLACSKTKKRFIMMEKSKPGRRSILRASAVLPLVAGMFMLFSFTAKDPVYVFADGDTTPMHYVDGEKVSEDSPGKDEPFIVVEVMPLFQGGDLMKFRDWVMEQIEYPTEAQQKKIEGKVTVSFIIDKDGSLKNINILHSPDKLLSDEVVRILESSPKWTPGTQKGKVVNVKFNLPVDFKLN